MGERIWANRESWERERVSGRENMSQWIELRKREGGRERKEMGERIWISIEGRERERESGIGEIEKVGERGNEGERERGNMGERKRREMKCESEKSRERGK